MPTQPLAAYEPMIPAVAALLATQPDLQAFFNALTPGYQREWARFIFGPASEATKQKHLTKMREVLATGYKSKRAYDQRAK